MLVPAATLAGLSASQLELVLAHELAHIRRRDYLVNLLQTAVETLLFYHPAVWWVSGRMRVEREHCCDDLAVAACGNPVGYARALADLEGLGTRGPVLAMAASGGSLFDRVARLVTPPAALSRTSRGLATRPLRGRPRPRLRAGLVAPRRASGRRRRFRRRARTGEPDRLAVVGTPATPSRRGGVASAADAPSRTVAYPLSKILEMASAGMTPEYIDEMEALGSVPLRGPAHELCSQGVDPDYVRGLTALGYRTSRPSSSSRCARKGVGPTSRRA